MKIFPSLFSINILFSKVLILMFDEIFININETGGCAVKLIILILTPKENLQKRL